MKGSIIFKLANTGIVVILLTMLLSFFSCEEEKIKFDTVHPEKEDEPTQYGTPFDNVPETADVVMYEVNIRASSAEGDLNGVRMRLDSIKALGVNVVWLMPIYTTSDLNSIGSPYAIRDYKEVNPIFGDLEDLRLLVEEAHEKDMAVMLDWVANHTGWDHPWMEDPTWYTRDDDGNIVSPNGWEDVADLNFDNQDMRAEMIEAMKYWVLEANIDGYRCDYAEGVPFDFWQEAISTLRNIPNRELVMFAEASDKNLLNAGFDLYFGWSYYGKLREIIIDGGSATVLTSAHNEDYQNVPSGDHVLRWITNHDDNAWDNTPQEIFIGERGAMAAFVLASYVGGAPLIYSGQEVAYPQQLPFFESGTTKIDWSINSDIYEEYVTLLSFRQQSEAVRRGSVDFVSSEDVVAFTRKSGSEEVLVLVNVRSDVNSFTVPESLEGTWHSQMTDEDISLTDEVSLEAFSYLILSK